MLLTKLQILLGFPVFPLVLCFLFQDSVPGATSHLVVSLDAFNLWGPLGLYLSYVTLTVLKNNEQVCLCLRLYDTEMISPSSLSYIRSFMMSIWPIVGDADLDCTVRMRSVRPMMVCIFLKICDVEFFSCFLYMNK
jgi:hypothetical protein